MKRNEWEWSEIEYRTLVSWSALGYTSDLFDCLCVLSDSLSTLPRLSFINDEWGFLLGVFSHHTDHPLRANLSQWWTASKWARYREGDRGSMLTAILQIWTQKKEKDMQGEREETTRNTWGSDKCGRNFMHAVATIDVSVFFFYVLSVFVVLTISLLLWHAQLSPPLLCWVDLKAPLMLFSLMKITHKGEDTLRRSGPRPCVRYITW